MRVSRNAIVPYPPILMYDLVLDVDRYPEFLPWCAEGQILELSEQRQVARLVVKKAGVVQHFTTENTLRKPHEILLSLVEGPFRSLSGLWRFQPLGDHACKVSLDLSFEPAGALAGIAMGAVFGPAANTMVDSFCQRARSHFAIHPKVPGPA